MVQIAGVGSSVTVKKKPVTNQYGGGSSVAGNSDTGKGDSGKPNTVKGTTNPYASTKSTTNPYASKPQVSNSPAPETGSSSGASESTSSRETDKVHTAPLSNPYAAKPANPYARSSKDKDKNKDKDRENEPAVNPTQPAVVTKPNASGSKVLLKPSLDVTGNYQMYSINMSEPPPPRVPSDQRSTWVEDNAGDVTNGTGVNYTIPVTVVDGQEVADIEKVKADIQKMKEAGINVISTDLSWHHVEYIKDQYDFKRYDEFVQTATDNGMQIMFVVSYSNLNYAPTQNTINEPEQQDAYARFAGEAAGHFKDNNVIYEIYNEPNLNSYWHEAPLPDPEKYATLVEKAARSIRAADPEAVILAGAVTKVGGQTEPGKGMNGIDFLREAIDENDGENSILDYVDGITMHAYGHVNGGPEARMKYFEQAKALILENQAINPEAANREIPIISSEWGFYKGVYGKEGKNPAITVDENYQAALIVRQLLLTKAQNGGRTPISNVYNFRNNGTNPNKHEHNYGLLNADGSDKEAYRLIKTMEAELDGMSIDGPVENKNGTYLMRFRGPNGEQKTVAWNVNDQGTVILGNEPIPVGVTPKFIAGDAWVP